MSSLEKLRRFRQRIDDLSEPIKQNLTQIAELDKECMAKQRFVEQLAIPVMQNWTTSRREIRQKRYKALKLALDKMEQLANEKVKIAARSYETIDNYVVQLDKLYAKINQQKSRKRVNTEKQDAKRSKRKSEAIVEPESQFDPTTVVDMPVDPNEPTYCLCHQVSFGQMVMCDNKHCPIEWFHFQCVGLINEPKGKWFCGVCKERLNKK